MDVLRSREIEALQKEMERFIKQQLGFEMKRLTRLDRRICDKIKTHTRALFNIVQEEVGNRWQELEREDLEGKKTRIGYYSDGSLRYEIPYVNGVENGVRKWYRKDGSLWYETHYVNGKKHGVEIEYDIEGNIEAETIYDNNKKN